MEDGASEFEDIARRHFETFSDSSRTQLSNLALVASYEAGIENGYQFTHSDTVRPGLKPLKEGGFTSEFRISEDGSGTRRLIDDGLPTLAIVQNTFSGQLELMAANLLEPARKKCNVLGLIPDSIENLHIQDDKL